MFTLSDRTASLPRFEPLFWVDTTSYVGRGTHRPAFLTQRKETKESEGKSPPSGVEMGVPTCEDAR